MYGAFVWRVKGSYTPPDDGGDIYGPIPEKTFECLVLTKDPQAGDVASLALEMRIGEQASWGRYNAQVTSMKLLDWAQGGLKVLV